MSEGIIAKTTYKVGYHNGLKDEQQRITKLLELKRKRVFENSLGQSGEIWHQYQGILSGIDMAIKLIKGEQK